MYLINKEENRISKLKQKTFTELKLREREHLQEWIANNPLSLGEELLIIQKEFSGFNETNERLDLLALDKFGNVVVIENKLDDSGKDVTWQAIKYASYCASLTKQDIIKVYQDFLGTKAIAQEKLSEFFEGRDLSEVVLNQGMNSQRIILVAANFRKEVTSTVLWLLNFKIRLQCFKVTPYAYEDQLFLNVEQILPTKETEDFAISISAKAQEEIAVQETLKNRHHVRIKFWENFINYSNSKNNLFVNNSPTKEGWIGKGIGISGISMNCAVSGSYCKTEITFNRGSKEENKELYDFIYERKNQIETEFGGELTWERMDDNVTCRVKHQHDGVSYFEEDDWDIMSKFLVDSSVRMEKAFKDPIRELSAYVRQR
ncbi:MAG TPA: DUF4268 domain-containing protein [Brumimicrobium sp.]|nr:DUF4268 domain-containing protein [Brumimicrobium sp.]